jgi:Tol biopolymer transport system component
MVLHGNITPTRNHRVPRKENRSEQGKCKAEMTKFTTILFLAALTLSGCKDELKVQQINYYSKEISTPILFGEGKISTSDNSEFDLTFSVDGLTVYFSRRKPNEKQKIYESDFKEGTWSTPKIASFSTDRDETSFITSDGKFFFFGSERPIPDKPNKGNFDMNVWIMSKSENGWSEPTPLPEPINYVQIENEQWPSSNNNLLFSIDNKTFYFTTMMRGSRSIKLYETNFDGVNFSQPRVIEGLFDDEKYIVYSAVISPNGKFLVFNSFGAPGGEGGEDIFVSKKTDAGWSKAKSIGKLVNTKDEESSPRFSRDGKYFFFSRAENLGNYEYGEWSIYLVETKFLNLDEL